MNFPTILLSLGRLNSSGLPAPRVSVLSLASTLLIAYGYYWFLTKLRKGQKNPSSILRVILVIMDLILIFGAFITVILMNSSVTDFDYSTLVSILTIMYMFLIGSRIYVVAGYGKGSVRKNLIAGHIILIFVGLVFDAFLITSSFF